MRRPKRYSAKSEINIIPLLDVLLVLVLIFMATAPIINQSVEVDLPKVSESKSISPQENDIVILEVSKKGYTLIIHQVRYEHLSVDEMMSKVKEQLALSDKTLFLIGGSKDVPYDEVMQALNMLQSSGVSSVSLMTEPI